MKILVAIDSFKGCLTSFELADAFEIGARKVYPDAEILKLSLADGGEGTVESLVAQSSGKLVNLEVSDPLMRKTNSFYGILDGKTAVIEMAAASGLPLLKPNERNPMKTSTYGTGELIKDAIKNGCHHFIVGIGGSATNDGGIGMLAALGFKFLDSNGEILNPIGENLIKIAKIDKSGVLKELEGCEFLVACDVDNPLYGERGAPNVYGRQKGATEEMVKLLDDGLKHYAEVVQESMGKDIGQYPGAGAAGGLGGGFLGFLNATLKPGIDIITDYIKLDEKMKDADLAITGEGRIDSQTINGKTPMGVCRSAKKFGIPVIGIAGSLSEDADLVHPHGLDAIFSIMNYPMSMAQAMDKSNAAKLVAKSSEEVLRLYKIAKGGK